MRIKIPIFLEIDARLSAKEVAVLKVQLSDRFTTIIQDNFDLGPLGSLESNPAIERRKKLEILTQELRELLHARKVENAEILSREELLKRIR